jgi:hypothetical protein
LKSTAESVQVFEKMGINRRLSVDVPRVNSIRPFEPVICWSHASHWRRLGDGNELVTRGKRCRMSLGDCRQSTILIHRTLYHVGMVFRKAKMTRNWDVFVIRFIVCE